MFCLPPAAGDTVAAPPPTLVSRRADACAAISSAAAEPLAGRAGGTRAWLLVEHSGPWAADAVRAFLGDQVVDALAERSRAVRVLLFRAHRDEVDRPRCVVVWSARPRPWMREGRLDDVRDVLDIEVEALGRGEAISFGEPRTAPLYGVCTHGKVDACCAEFGRPVLRALQATSAEVVEVTHVGGDRFAANMVVWPHGLYYGRLTPASAQAAVAAHGAGRVHPPNLRGRSDVVPAAQVAEYAVRLVTGLDGIDAVRALAAAADDAGTWTVEIATSARRFRVTTALAPHGAPVVPGCGQTTATQQSAWSVRDVTDLGPVLA